MGWERKRGKTRTAQSLSHGESAPELDELLRVGDRAELEGYDSSSRWMPIRNSCAIPRGG
jgi:hypothetical protein